MKRRGQPIYSLHERLLRMILVDPNTGCHEWQGTKCHGYGRLTIGSRTDGTRRTGSAHRISYFIHHGKLPEGHEVCHRCDNPSCINPEHLFSGTRQDNVDDREAKGRNRPNKGSKVGTSKLKEVDIPVIINMKMNGNSSRDIAKKYNVDHSTILNIVNRSSWKHVEITPKPEE